MKSARFAAISSFMFAGISPVPSWATDTPCQRLSYAGSAYTVCSFDPAKAEISVHWRRGNGKPFASLGAFRRAVSGGGRRFLFAMNGGMYHEDLSPVGYHVEARAKLKNANTRRGPGNFHMLPNGIFFVEKGRAGVMETRAFLKRNRRPDYATQSGPMLVISGRIHPRFKANSQHRKPRNGVGVSADGRRVYFAISHGAVTFWNFAKLFQQKLKTPNALFLDGGSAPQMIGPGVSRPSFAPVGPIVAVTAGK
ncbi:MAG: phosphodiester glycosidase family protein [Pseudomonadota bacterium]